MMKFTYKGNKKNVSAIVFMGLSLLCSGTVFTSCGNDEPSSGTGEGGGVNSGQSSERERTLLVYAVASNNLSENFKKDSLEMLDGMRDVDLSSNSLMVYRILPGERPKLLEVVKDEDGKMGMKEVKSYDRLEYSTDPKRLRQVIEDMRRCHDSKSYGLVMWSHGTGWSYAETSHPSNREGMFYTFGYDAQDWGRDEMNIDEMAEAIPDGMFDFIWFDACYMAGIETVYQLRNKCSRLVAYPTEICNDGMPYDTVLPYIMRKGEADLTEGARLVYEYYNDRRSPVSVSVIEMDMLEAVAESARRIYSECNGPISTYGLQNYARYYGPFFDLGQMTLRMADELPESYKTDFKNALDKAVVYKAISDRDFSYHPIDKDVYSGLSAHYYQDGESDANIFYRSLDWYKRVWAK